MFRVFLLLITLNMVCMISYFASNRMDSKFNSSEESIKLDMIKASHELEGKLKNEIHDGQEPDDLIKFRESWLLRLQDIKSLGIEKKGIEKIYMSIIIPLFLTFKFAVIDYFYVDSIAVYNGFNIYTCHIGWVFLLFSCVIIMLSFRRMNNCINMVMHAYMHERVTHINHNNR